MELVLVDLVDDGDFEFVDFAGLLVLLELCESVEEGSEGHLAPAEGTHLGGLEEGGYVVELDPVVEAVGVEDVEAEGDPALVVVVDGFEADGAGVRVALAPVVLALDVPAALLGHEDVEELLRDVLLVEARGRLSRLRVGVGHVVAAHQGVLHLPPLQFRPQLLDVDASPLIPGHDSLGHSDNDPTSLLTTTTAKARTMISPKKT